MNNLEKQVSGIIQQSIIIIVLLAGGYFYKSIPDNQIKTATFAGLGTCIVGTFPIYLRKSMRAKIRPYMSNDATYDPVYRIDPVSGKENILIMMEKKIPSILYQPIYHYFAPQFIETALVHDNGLISFCDNSVNFLALDQDNQRKIPKGLKIIGNQAKQIIQLKKEIESKTRIKKCDLKFIEAILAMRDSGIYIEE